MNKKITRFLSSVLMLLFACTAMAFESGQTVRITHGGRTLSVENSSLDAGGAAVMWTETNTNSQRWIVTVNESRGTLTFANVYSELCLATTSAANNNAQISQQAANVASSRGSWVLEEVEGEPDTYIIYFGTAKRYCLAAAAGTAEGSKVTIITASGADESRTHWKVETVEPVPNQFTEAIRDDMMESWKAQYYRSASTGHVIGKGGWWGDAEMFEIILDAYETTGQSKYLTMFDELYRNFCQRNNTDWSGNSFNDDIAWMCIACIRAYLMSGNTDYRDKAKSNFDKMYSRANVYGDGTLVWCQNWEGNGKAGTNSCINGPAAVCACYLGIAYNNESYFNKAKTIYAGERNLLMEKNADGSLTGKVWDSYDKKKDDGSRNYWASSYNQGTQLGAALMLYNHFGDEMYKKDADAIMTWTYKNMSNSHKIVTACQNITGDLSGFKGILMRYVRRYAAEHAHPEYYEWMARSAYHAWNNRNSKGIIDNAWHSKTNETMTYMDNGQEKSYANAGEGTFTSVSAAFNAHLGAVDQHNPFTRIEPKHFNGIRGANIISGTDDETDMVRMRNTNYLSFARVDFGQKAASHVTLRANFYRTTAKVAFYLDDPSTTRGTLLCTIQGNEASALKTWETLEKELNVPATGLRTVYMVCTGTNNTDLADVNWFQFSSHYTMYSDLTNNGGQFTTSFAAPANQAFLLDDDPCTVFSGTLPAEGEAWIQYQSPAPVRLQGYSLFSGLGKGKDPAAWTLQASSDGSTWQTIDQQSEVTFATRGQRMLFPVSVDQEYTHFRMLLTPTAGQSVVEMSEWQLLGQCIQPNDITADGGTITEGAESLIDHVGGTAFTTALPVVYRANGLYNLFSYSVTAPAEGVTPAAWKLEGSNNGTAWTAIDAQQDFAFPYAGSTCVIPLQNVPSYTYFRLTVATEDASLAQWQMFGNLNFGTFYADVTSIATVRASDGTRALQLVDDDGRTFSTLQGEDIHWTFDMPMPVKAIAYSLVSADDKALDPKDVELVGIDADGTSTVISTRTFDFATRGARFTNTLSSSRLFNQIRLNVKSTAGGGNVARIADFEFYATAIAEAGSAIFPVPASVEATLPGVSTTEAINRLNDQVRTSRYRAAFTKADTITLRYEDPVQINTYALTASKDTPASDPRSWTLQGSNDGQQWDVLDSRTDITFSHRYATQFYDCQQAEQGYSQYRLIVDGLNGGDYIHLAELQLLQLEKSANAIALPTTEATLALRGGALQVNAPVAAVLRIYDMQGCLVSALPVSAGQNELVLPRLHGLHIAVMTVGGRSVALKIHM